MEQNTMISNALDYNDYKKAYDNYCKLILHNKQIVSRILKEVIPEYKNLSYDEISDLIDDMSTKENHEKTEQFKKTAQEFPPIHRRDELGLYFYLLFCTICIYNIIAYIDIIYILWYTICMKDNYVHARTAVYNLNYHIVWCTKYRRSVLSDAIIPRLQEILKQVGQDKGFTVVLCNVGDRNHVHCFVQIPPKLSVTSAVRYLKGISGRLLLKEFPEIQKDLWKGNLWNDSYFVESIGSTCEENIKQYIERQKVCQG